VLTMCDADDCSAAASPSCPLGTDRAGSGAAVIGVAHSQHALQGARATALRGTVDRAEAWDGHD